MGRKLSQVVRDELYHRRVNVLKERQDKALEKARKELKKYDPEYSKLKRKQDEAEDRISLKRQALHEKKSREFVAAERAINAKYAGRYDALGAEEKKIRGPLDKFVAKMDKKFNVQSGNYFGKTYPYLQMPEGKTPKEQAKKDLADLLIKLELSDGDGLDKVIEEWTNA